MSSKSSLIKISKPYDKFKAEFNTIEQNKRQNYRDKLIYKKTITKSLLLSKILNRTKSVLKNKSDFSDYMKQYNSMVTKSSFKNPETENYPLLRKNRSDMISIKNQSRMVNKNPKKKIDGNIFNSKMMNSTMKGLFKNNLSMSLNSNRYKNRKLVEWMRKKREKNKLFLFEDFFYKWNKKEESEKNSKIYSELNYDEKKIFYSDYTDFIKEKINFCQKNKLENLQKKLKIDFEDKNKKKIKLELISMKIIFEPIKEDRFRINKNKKNNKNIFDMNDDYNFEDYEEIYYTNNENNTNNSREEYYTNYINKDEKSKKKNIITFPLSYVFLFYINGLEYFKNILIGSIKFSNDFKNVFFEENEIYSIIQNKTKLKKNNSKDYNNRVIRHKNSTKTHLTKKSGTIRGPVNKQFLSLKSLNSFSMKNKDKYMDDKMSYEDSEQNNDEPDDVLYITNKKIEKMHSNQDLRNKVTKKKEIKYNEYCFRWETPDKSYKVRIVMPIIIFWSEHIKKNIMTYCDKELFLFLLKKNFVNWDYYILNYLFSLKIFRLIILKGISIYKKYTIDKSDNNTIDINNLSTLYLKKPLDYINDKTLMINLNKKIYNQYNTNNETYKFFYTDNFSINSIIELNSFHIFIENDKVNKNICYEFCLNFKQMCHLINISHYEDLENFLSKIVQLNLEEGKINLDLSVLEFYSNNLLGQIYTNVTKYVKPKYSKKESITSIKTIRAKSSYKRSESEINIVMPFITVEQYVKSEMLNNNVKKIDLNMNFLNLIKNYEINLWSKKILQLLDIRNNNFSNMNSNLELVKVKSKDFKYYVNEKHFEELAKKYDKVKRHSKSLHFKLRKVNI